MILEPDHNIMIDIETLGTSADAVVLSVGMVEMNYRKITNALYLEVGDISDQLSRGRTVSQSTINWWTQQSEAAKKVLRPTSDRGSEQLSHTLGTERLLRGIMGWEPFATSGHTYSVWGNGAAFDNAIMEHLFGMYGLECPWSFRDNMCYRTLRTLVPSVSTLENPCPHDALQDATYQMKHLRAMFIYLNER